MGMQKWMSMMAMIFVILVNKAGAQETLTPASRCRALACGLVFDWGTGRTAGSYNADRRYGSGDDFESNVRRALVSRGVTPRVGETLSFTITVRPKVSNRAMCDQLPGTSTSYTCTVVTDAAVNFTSADSTLKAPGALRLSNRCNGGTTFVSMAQFGQYVGEMVWLSISPGTNEKKPAMRC